MFNRKPNTENAIKGITKALDELDAVAVAEQTEINNLYDQIADLSNKREEAFARRDRAKNIAKRFADLIQA